MLSKSVLATATEPISRRLAFVGKGWLHAEYLRAPLGEGSTPTATFGAFAVTSAATDS